MATHSSVLAWRIPGTGDPGGLPSVGSHRVRHERSDLAAPSSQSITPSPFPLGTHTYVFYVSLLQTRNFELLYLIMCMCILQSRQTVRDTMAHSPPGFSVHRLLQARILEWVASSSEVRSFREQEEGRAAQAVS